VQALVHLAWGLAQHSTIHVSDAFNSYFQLNRINSMHASNLSSVLHATPKFQVPCRRPHFLRYCMPHLKFRACGQFVLGILHATPKFSSVHASSSYPIPHATPDLAYVHCPAWGRQGGSARQACVLAHQAQGPAGHGERMPVGPA